MRIGIQSRGIPSLTPFFPEWDVQLLPKRFADTRGLDALAGWSLKPSGRATRALARKRQLPYIALEDGFVRSYDLGVHGAKPWALVADDTGVYYDATAPSQLERLIATAPVPPEAELLLARMREARISKYNSGRLDKEPPQGPYILLIDQCADDASIAYGMADAKSFRRMVAFAQAQGGRLVIKTHPDVASGKRRGFLSRMKLPKDAMVISSDIHPHRLFEQATQVHVVTSLLGMEALMAGLPVYCHGAPFYAGWGLTTDLALPASVAARRVARPSLLQLFSAAYIHYARYVDPYSGAPSTLGATIDHIVWLRGQFAQRPHHIHAWGFSHWKQPHVTPFLVPPGGSVTYHTDFGFAAHKARSEGTPLAIWAAKEPVDAAEYNVPLLRVEDGFVRSRGLGSDLIAADSLAIDPVGIYFDSAMPSAIEQWLEAGSFDAALLARAAHVRAQLLAGAISKYNIGGDALPQLPAGKTIHLVVGQVEDDASIRRGGDAVCTNEALLAAVRAHYPNDWILYKPHPDVLAGNRIAGTADRETPPSADQLVGHVALPALLARVDMLHTMTSLAGFEMLLRGGCVVTYGRPFYAGWGLTEDKAGPFPRRTRRITLDELVAAAILLYPRYHDWQAQLPTTPERTIARMGMPVAAKPASTTRQLARFYRWLGGRR